MTHAKLTAYSAAHPQRAAIAMGVLVILTIVLVIHSARWKAKLDQCRELPRMMRMAHRRRPRRREGFASTAAAAGTPFDWTTPVCDASWDPAAVAESQALAEMGSLAIDHYGEKNIQTAAGGTYDQKGLSNSQLIQLMQRGSAP